MKVLKSGQQVMQRRVEFSVGNQRLVGDLHLPDDLKPPFPCVLLSHGYMSNRSGEKHLQMAYRFPLESIAVSGSSFSLPLKDSI